MLETIYELCDIIDRQNKLIKAQAEALAQENIAKDIADNFHQTRESIDKDLDLLEHRLRRL